MKLLALESSTELFTAALYLDGRIVEREGTPGASHSEIALPTVRALLEAEGLDLRELSGVAFGAGPGAFTGLRLAVSVAQGLAFGAGLPLLGVGSLEALALGAGAEQVYVCTDARMNEVYCAAYRRNDDMMDTVLSPLVVPPQRAPLPPGLGWLGCGSGFAVHGERMRARMGHLLAAVRAELRPRAGAVARLAAQRFARGEADDAAWAAPHYVRDKVALTRRERLARGGCK